MIPRVKALCFIEVTVSCEERGETLQHLRFTGSFLCSVDILLIGCLHDFSNSTGGQPLPRPFLA